MRLHATNILWAPLSSGGCEVHKTPRPQSAGRDLNTCAFSVACDVRKQSYGLQIPPEIKYYLKKS